LKTGDLVFHEAAGEVGILLKVVIDPFDGCHYFDVLLAGGHIRCNEKECSSLPEPPLYLSKGDLKYDT